MPSIRQQCEFKVCRLENETDIWYVFYFLISFLKPAGDSGYTISNGMGSHNCGPTQDSFYSAKSTMNKKSSKSTVLF